MPPRTKAQRLFGAACLKLGLERGQGQLAGANEIYQGALVDLELTEDEVEQFLSEHRADVERAFAARDSAKGD